MILLLKIPKKGSKRKTKIINGDHRPSSIERPAVSRPLPFASRQWPDAGPIPAFF
jgi:hypothetical protein